MTTTSTPVGAGANLRHRLIAAGGWSVFGFGGSQAVRLVSNLVMTRILLPDMFGLMAVATVIMVGISMSFDLGLRQNVVRSNRGSEAGFLGTIWVLQIGRGFLIAIVGAIVSAILLAGIELGLAPASTIYSNPALPGVVLALSLAAAIGGFESTKVLQSSRNLQLGRLTQIELSAQIVSLSVMFAWASLYPSIWALVVGNITWIILRVILTHAVLRGTADTWNWNRDAFAEIIKIGKWIFPSSIVGFIANSADRLLMGAFVTPTVLGVYSIAFFVMSGIEQIFSKLANDVLFPGLSEIARERPAALSEAYYKARFAIGIPTTFCAGVLAVVGQEVIDLLYDARYSSAGWMLEILAICLVTVQFHLATQCFVALGNVRLLFNLALTRAIAVMVLLPLGFGLNGLQGGLWGLVLSYFSWLPAVFFYKARFGLLLPKREVVFVPVFIMGVFMGLLTLRLSQW